MKKAVSLLLLLCAASLAASGQLMDTIAARLDYQRMAFPQEKVHVTTDRSQYLTGDTIWLRAFVVDASTHRPSELSKFVYVDLLSPVDSVSCRVKLRRDSGAYCGYIPLDVQMPEGDYTIASHTMFMESMPEDYFFRKQVRVRSALAVKSEIAVTQSWNGDNLEVGVRYFAAATGEPLPSRTMAATLDDGRTRDKFSDDNGVK
ncbi:MAG: hypothetical protein KBT10_00820, partial [Bacteroidales bacterium]|nr:hypothetical protein [Candidatus Sodaliphilus aphodohippi]